MRITSRPVFSSALVHTASSAGRSSRRRGELRDKREVVRGAEAAACSSTTPENKRGQLAMSSWQRGRPLNREAGLLIAPALQKRKPDRRLTAGTSRSEGERHAC